MRKAAYLTYGVICYLLFFGTFLYTIGFLGNWIVPKTIDGPASTLPLWLALLVNLGLLSLFAVQHSGMARPEFKRWWTRIVPQPIERATYVLASSVVLWVIYWGWQPLPTALYTTEGAARIALTALYLGGYGLVLYSTILISHLDLFGIGQVVRYWHGREVESSHFVTPTLYRFIRHPLYVGWFVVFWATPEMTVGHLLFAAVCTGYILAAIPIEERDLVGEFGETYEQYRRTTPAFVPRIGSQAGPTGEATATRSASPVR